MHNKLKEIFKDYGYIFWLIGLSTSFLNEEMRSAAIFLLGVLTSYMTYIIAAAAFVSLYIRIKKLERAREKSKATIIKLEQRQITILRLITELHLDNGISISQIYGYLQGDSDNYYQDAASILADCEFLKSLPFLASDFNNRAWWPNTEGRAWLSNNGFLNNSDMPSIFEELGITSPN